MKAQHSPFTVQFMQKAKSAYGDTGLYWASLIELTGMFVSTNDKWLFMKFGSSGCGKTISDNVAIQAFGGRHNPYQISGRLTPAGVIKLYKAARRDPDREEELETLKRANLLHVEDLSRCTTHYLKLTSLQFLAGLTKTTKLDDLTSDGGLIGCSLGDTPKKCMVSGTPSDWEEISSSSVYNEFIDRRSLTVMALMAPREWQAREDFARNSSVLKDDWQLVLQWKDMIDSLDRTLYVGPMQSRHSSEYREKLYMELSTFKRFPENVFTMIDSLAEGHARLNGRHFVLGEDYEILYKLFRRFLVISDVKKKELFLMEELVRSHGILTLDELTYRMRKRARSEDLPDLDVVAKTVVNYAKNSKYLQKLTRGGKGSQVYISLGQNVWSLFNSWSKEMEELCSA